MSNPQSLNRYAYALNNPTTLTDPLGLDPCESFNPRGCPPGSDCEEWDNGSCSGNPTCDSLSILVPFGCVNPAPCVVLDVPCGSSGGYPGGTGGAPAPPSAPPAGQPPLAGMGNAAFGGLALCAQVGVKIGGVPYPPGAASCYLTLLGIFGPSAGALVSYFEKTPYTFSLTEGLAVQVAYIPTTNTLCGAAGVGVAAPTKAISFGTYIHGNLGNAVPVLTGWSTSASVQLEPTLGYQATWNSNGSLGGPTFSGPGVSISRTWGACTQVPSIPW